MTSDHPQSVRLDVSNDEVHSSRYTLMTKYPTGSQERESSAHLFEEELEYVKEDDDDEYKGDEDENEVGEEKEEKRGEEDEAPSSSGNDYRPFILPKFGW